MLTATSALANDFKPYPEVNMGEERVVHQSTEGGGSVLKTVFHTPLYQEDITRKDNRVVEYGARGNVRCFADGDIEAGATNRHRYRYTVDQAAELEVDQRIVKTIIAGIEISSNESTIDINVPTWEIEEIETQLNTKPIADDVAEAICDEFGYPSSGFRNVSFHVQNNRELPEVDEVYFGKYSKYMWNNFPNLSADNVFDEDIFDVQDFTITNH